VRGGADPSDEDPAVDLDPGAPAETDGAEVATGPDNDANAEIDLEVGATA
jgi:hypothetical protein